MRGSKILTPREWTALVAVVDFVEQSEHGCDELLDEACATLRARIYRDHHRRELRRLEAAAAVAVSQG